MLGPSVAWYIAISASLFAIGSLGVLLRRSPLIILLSLEIMLNGGNLALIAFSRSAQSVSPARLAAALMICLTINGSTFA